jgi:transposase-like protein
MQRVKIRCQHKEQQRRRLIEQWQRSGLSVWAFCEQHRLAVSTFYAWRRALQQRDRPANGSQLPDAVTFLPVHVQNEPSDQQLRLELVLAGGQCLRIPPGFDPDTLRAILAVLEDPSC